MSEEYDGEERRHSSHGDAVDILLEDANDLAQSIEEKTKAISANHSSWEKTSALMSDVARLLAMFTRMFLPIYREYNRKKGILARQGGMRFKAFGMEISGQGAIQAGFQIVVVGLLLACFLLLRGISLKRDADGGFYMGRQQTSVNGRALK